jgi:pimeloyl-ACP methyl ester carboxylesterase
MTDGIHPWSRMLGDIKFHQHQVVDPAAAQQWRAAMRGDALSRPAADLAARLGYDGRPAPAGGLVPLQPGGARAPLVCLHPAGGSVLCYRDLAQALGADQPVYGIEAQGLAPGEAPLTRLEAIAERSLAVLLAAFPRGPYRLLGWSFGGLVAYEMARLLAASGRTVELLAILDAGPEPAAAELPGGPAAADSRAAPGRRGAPPGCPRFDGADLLAAAFRSVLPLTAEEVRALPPSERLPRLLEQEALCRTRDS